MSHEREAMLGRIRQALQSGYLPDAMSPLPPPATPQSTDLSTPELMDRFTIALEAVDGEVLHAPTGEEAGRQVTELIEQYGDGSVLTWPDSELPVPVAPTLSAAGIDQVFVHLAADQTERQNQTEALAGPLVGLTGALAGLADTGSLAMLSGPQRPMATSLLPETHIALLQQSDIVGDMATFLKRYQATASTVTSRNLVFVTGPSRTADIELTLTRGVHGPKRVIVVLIG